MLTRVFRCPHGELIIHTDAALCFYAIVKGMAAELPQSVINNTNSGADVEPRVEKCVNVCYGRSSMFSEPLRSRRVKTPRHSHVPYRNPILAESGREQ